MSLNWTWILCGRVVLMALHHQIRKKYKTRIEATVAKLRAQAGADAPIDPHMAVKKRVAEVAYLMALLHGGDWRVQIDHEEGLVMVVRRRPCPRPRIF